MAHVEDSINRGPKIDRHDDVILIKGSRKEAPDFGNLPYLDLPAELRLNQAFGYGRMSAAQARKLQSICSPSKAAMSRHSLGLRRTLF